MGNAVENFSPEASHAQVELSVVVPSYLEEENLRLLLPRIIKTATELTPEFEVLIIDTMEPLDNTRAVCEQFPQVRYIQRKHGNMFGDAVRTGIDQSRGKYVIFMDADGSHSPSFIKNLYQHKEEGEVVIASRYVKGGYTENNPSLIWMSYILNCAYRVVLNLKCNDVSNSFKLYRGDQLRSLKLKCSNFDIVEEILFKLNRKYSIKIKELPFTFRKRMFGDTKRNLPLFILTYVWTLARLRLSID
ncbi:MAG: glycosyltransferase [Bdellovibrionales bacterium]|nr:glycosyltransferase [Bdellovibrionales bacterium]